MITKKWERNGIEEIDLVTTRPPLDGKMFVRSRKWKSSDTPDKADPLKIDCSKQNMKMFFISQNGSSLITDSFRY